MAADEARPENAAAVTAFASDVSGAATEVMTSVEAWSVSPPTDMETIGFYSGEDGSAEERLWLATVSLLDSKGYLTSCEDKYCNEIVSTWQNAGLIEIAALAAPAREIFGAIESPASVLLDGEPDDEKVKRSQRMFFDHFGEATQQLERQIESRGKVLLSVDATEGDTLFFVALSPDLGRRWSGRGMATTDSGRVAGVRPVMWDRYWGFLTYALGSMVGEDDAYRRPPPPGTRDSSGPLPLATDAP